MGPTESHPKNTYDIHYGNYVNDAALRKAIKDGFVIRLFLSAFESRTCIYKAYGDNYVHVEFASTTKRFVYDQYDGWSTKDVPYDENVEALKEVYVFLGGYRWDVESIDDCVEILNAISELMNGANNATTTPDAIRNIAAVTVPKPSGFIKITENGEYPVSEYESVKVAIPTPELAEVIVNNNSAYTVTIENNPVIENGYVSRISVLIGAGESDTVACFRTYDSKNYCYILSYTADTLAVSGGAHTSVQQYGSYRVNGITHAAVEVNTRAPYSGATPYTPILNIGSKE